MRYELTEYERTAIKPMLPNKPRGVPRVNDRRVQRHLLEPAFGRAMARSAGHFGPAPLVTIASFGGGGLAFGTGLWMRRRPIMTRQCR